MRTSDCDILIVPGYSNSGPDHWQSRWERKLSSARRVEQDDWERPLREAWIARLVATVARCRRPAILVAHSLGVIAVAHAAPSLPPGVVRGAFLVAPPDVERPDLPERSTVLSRLSLLRPSPSRRSSSPAAPIPIAPTDGRRISPSPGARPCSTQARPGTSTRRAATAPGRKASCASPAS